MKKMRAIIYWTVLCPVISFDYWLRKHRLRPDRMYWADRLAINWGYFGPWDFNARP